MSVLLETSLGDLTIDVDPSLAPKASTNFLKLCKVKYYNDAPFYKVDTGFVVEVGDLYVPEGVGPATGAQQAAAAASTPASDAAAAAPAAPSSIPARQHSHRGGDSIYGLLYGSQARLFTADPPSASFSHSKKGTVSLVPVAGMKSNLYSSLFLITLADGLEYLDANCIPFGRVVEGLDEWVAKLNTLLVDPVSKQPQQHIRIRHTIVLDDPFPDPKGLEALLPPASPQPILHPFDYEVLTEEERLERERLASMTEEEIAAEREAKEAASRAVVLEMLGDLPSADVAPPSNVLFVCKLNPITRAEDLELIFSRFGNIVACDIIKDWKTGASLQYGFIEFDDDAACEQAYLKMNNVLIDERRIKVDFSQSVAKQWNQYRRDKLKKKRAETQAAAQKQLPSATSSVPSSAATPAAVPTAAPLPAAAPSSSRWGARAADAPAPVSAAAAATSNPTSVPSRPVEPVTATAASGDKAQRRSRSRSRSSERRRRHASERSGDRRSRSSRSRSRSRGHRSRSRSPRHRSGHRHDRHGDRSSRRSRSSSRHRRDHQRHRSRHSRSRSSSRNRAQHRRRDESREREYERRR